MLTCAAAAAVLERQDRPRDAAALLRFAATLAPHAAPVWLQLGAALERAGDARGALDVPTWHDVLAHKLSEHRQKVLMHGGAVAVR